LSTKEDDGTGAKPKKKTRTDSAVGQKLSELATKAVIIMIFMLLILLPLFNADFWINADTGQEGAAYAYKNVLSYTGYTKTPANMRTLSFNAADAGKSTTDLTIRLAQTTVDLLADFTSQSLGPMVKVTLPEMDVDYYLDPGFDKLRPEDLNVGVLGYKGSVIRISQDGSKSNALQAWLNVIRTFYICFLLLIGSSLFASSTYNLIIQPIERMIEKVVGVIERPQRMKEKAFIDAEEADLRQNLNVEEEPLDEEAVKQQSMETEIIEDAIKKIGILVAVGLGDAGSSLIASYLTAKSDEKGSSEVLLKNVQELEAIFGFCDIRNFTDATEILEKDVMVFVNTIADIVHTISDRNLGAANKNIGDAFLIVWKIPQALQHPYMVTKDPLDKSPLPKAVQEYNRFVFTNLADMAMFAILKMYAEINRSWNLVKYVRNERLQARIANYKVKLGYGLHYGWAIEGAIGSHFKVDVSYLSPHVNMASWLEGNTKDYGVPLLLSHEFTELLSEPVRKCTRMIDVFKFPGSDEINKLYTPNISDKAFDFPSTEPLKEHTLKTKECYTFKQLLISEIEAKKLVGPPVYENDVDLRLLMCRNNPEFIAMFKKGMNCFFHKEDKWDEARTAFEESLRILRDEDGPTKKLMDIMQKHNYKKPSDWADFRLMEGGGGH
jgi:class 3 adenylate cyclase